jgi:FlaA1/EpsC-like NDP-sugar epimerase
MNLFKRSGIRIKEMFTFKTLLVLVFDAFLVSISFFFALYIAHDFRLDMNLVSDFLIELPMIILMYWLIFEVFQMYRSLWKFASFEEVVKGFLANASATFLSYFMVRVFYENPLQSQLYIIAFFVATFLTLAVRMSYRIFRVLRKYFIYEETIEKALIVGAGDAGNLVLNELEINDSFDTNVVGFIDDDPSKINKYIHNIKVLGNVEDIPRIVEEEAIDTVYVALPRASQSRIKYILNKIQETNANMKLFPPFYELLRERTDTSVKIRDVKIEDLLGRDEIKLDEDGIRDYIDGKIILVTGGGGSIGSELVRQVRHFNPSKIIILDIYENNTYDLQMELDRMYRLNKVVHKPEIVVLIASVRDEQRLDEIFDTYKPNVVFHAAAHKHVPLMEASPLEALKNNVVGTYNVAMAADKHKTEKFVLISTDKAVNPTNIMGASKRAAEKVVMTINETSETDFAAVRFGNVLGSNGSVIPLFKKQIEDGGPITVTHPEIIRYFMTIPEACQLVIQAGAYANGGELFVLDMGEPVKILDLAEKMIRLSGLEPYKDIEIQFTGLRPGEKMYEELLLDIKTAKKTTNELIFIETNVLVLKENEEPILELVKFIKEINHEIGDIKEIIKSYISSYQK